MHLLPECWNKRCAPLYQAALKTLIGLIWSLRILLGDIIAVTLEGVLDGFFRNVTRSGDILISSSRLASRSHIILFLNVSF